MTDSTMLSVSTWLMMRPREPPSAARIAISRLRPVARTSSRFATFAQAISRHEPDGADQHEQRLPHVAHEHLADRLHAETALRAERVLESRLEVRR